MRHQCLRVFVGVGRNEKGFPPEMGKIEKIELLAKNRENQVSLAKKPACVFLFA
jgi:hypothetical protein